MSGKVLGVSGKVLGPQLCVSSAQVVDGDLIIS